MAIFIICTELLDNTLNGVRIIDISFNFTDEES